MEVQVQFPVCCCFLEQEVDGIVILRGVARNFQKGFQNRMNRGLGVQPQMLTNHACMYIHFKLQ